jgi:hypothetical protein
VTAEDAWQGTVEDLRMREGTGVVGILGMAPALLSAALVLPLWLLAGPDGRAGSWGGCPATECVAEVAVEVVVLGAVRVTAIRRTQAVPGGVMAGGGWGCWCCRVAVETEWKVPVWEVVRTEETEGEVRGEKEVWEVAVRARRRGSRCARMSLIDASGSAVRSRSTMVVASLCQSGPKFDSYSAVARALA